MNEEKNNVELEDTNMEIEGYQAKCEELAVDERCDHDCIIFGSYFLSEVD